MTRLPKKTGGVVENLIKGRNGRRIKGAGNNLGLFSGEPGNVISWNTQVSNNTRIGNRDCR